MEKRLYSRLLSLLLLENLFVPALGQRKYIAQLDPVRTWGQIESSELEIGSWGRVGLPRMEVWRGEGPEVVETAVRGRGDSTWSSDCGPVDLSSV